MFVGLIAPSARPVCGLGQNTPGRAGEDRPVGRDTIEVGEPGSSYGLDRRSELRQIRQGRRSPHAEKGLSPDRVAQGCHWINAGRE